MKGSGGFGAFEDWFADEWAVESGSGGNFLAGVKNYRAKAVEGKFSHHIADGQPIKREKRTMVLWLTV